MGPPPRDPLELAAPTERTARVVLRGQLTPKGWCVVVINHGPGIARHVSVRLVAPLGTGVMPWIVEPAAPLHLPSGGEATLSVILNDDSATGVVCDLVYRDVKGVHKRRERVAIDGDSR